MKAASQYWPISSFQHKLNWVSFDAQSKFDSTRLIKIDFQMIEEIKLPCGEAPIQQTQDGKFLICLSEGVCLEFLGLWEAQDHLRSLELCGLTTKRWTTEPSW